MTRKQYAAKFTVSMLIGLAFSDTIAVAVGFETRPILEVAIKDVLTAVISGAIGYAVYKRLYHAPLSSAKA